MSRQNKKTKEYGEVVMATAGIVVCSRYGMACTECNDPLIAPKWSAYVSSHEVRHVWSCEKCGRQIEMAVNPRTSAASEPSKSAESFIAA
jgi:uncharacterized protein with PIN domain